jgi:hypothetical protein
MLFKEIGVEKVELTAHKATRSQLELITELFKRKLSFISVLKLGEVACGTRSIPFVEPRVSVKHVKALFQLAQYFKSHKTLMKPEILNYQFKK